MDWPSERVAQGGLFHPAKVRYSPETRKFLKELMEESKLTNMQRQKVNYSLRSGDPLPKLTPDEIQKKKLKEEEVLVRPGSSKRRSYASIVESGALERERFYPNPKNRGVDREFAKRHLQDFMAFGKEVKQPIKKPPKKIEAAEKINRFDELKREIQERVDWLADMEKLGQANQYRLIIEQQINTRINEMEKLKPADK